MIDASYIPYDDSDELFHHGVKGQKWGVRRTQSQLGHGPSTMQKVKRSVTNAGRTVAKYTKKGATAGYQAVKKARQDHIEREKRQISSKRSLHTLSDQELRQRISRMQLEEEYTRHLQQTGRIKPSLADVGKKIVKESATIVAKEAVTALFRKKTADFINELAGEVIMKPVRSDDNNGKKKKKGGNQENHSNNNSNNNHEDKPPKSPKPQAPKPAVSPQPQKSESEKVRDSIDRFKKQAAEMRKWYDEQENPKPKNKKRNPPTYGLKL